MQGGRGEVSKSSQLILSCISHRISSSPQQNVSNERKRTTPEEAGPEGQVQLPTQHCGFSFKRNQLQVQGMDKM